jgi:hypothetical protein
LAAYFYLNGIGDQNVCEKVIAGPDIKPHIFELCGPPRLVDLTPFVLFIAILLWPDLSEFAVSGLLTLKRRVSEHEARQDSFESRLTQVDQRVTQVAALGQLQMQGQTAAATINLSYPPSQEDVRRRIEEKEAITHPPPVRDVPPDAEDWSNVLGEFLAKYSELEPYIQSRFRRQPVYERRLAHLSPEQQQLVDQWYELFHDEIQALRQTRNVALHDPDSISPETLRRATQNAQELARILFGRIGHPPD